MEVENMISVIFGFVFYILSLLLTVDGLGIFCLVKQNENKQEVDF